MIFSVVVCTYRRPASLLRLLKSIDEQELLPFELLVIDGSEDDVTHDIVNELNFSFNIRYNKVAETQRGLTKQRNVGIQLISQTSEIVIFLDDDLVLLPGYFLELIKAFDDMHCIGAEGLIKNENFWKPIKPERHWPNFMTFDGWALSLGARQKLRFVLGLFPSDIQPGHIPAYGHGLHELPPNGKIYDVEHLMGGITAWRTDIFKKIQFNSAFEGYGLYEDFDFSVRANKLGKLLSVTNAQCLHLHDPLGRPNTYKYGKMVVRNGWYVWRLKHPAPGILNIFKWHLITLLLALLRFGNAMFGTEKKAAFMDFSGRIVAYLSLFFRPPVITGK